MRLSATLLDLGLTDEVREQDSKLETLACHSGKVEVASRYEWRWNTSDIDPRTQRGGIPGKVRRTKRRRLW